jgi:RNA recognition motif-containing protein
VSDAVLTAAFQKYASFQKAKVVRYSHNGKSKGYGFVSLGDSIEGARVLREMQGKYVGNRPIQLRKSTADERTVKDKKGAARMREVTVREPKPKQPRVEGRGPPPRW